MMKIFRYILGALGLTLMSARAHSQNIIAYDLTSATAGSSYVGQQAFTGTMGMEFDVNAANITVTSLGVFDSGGDGFHHVLTAYLFNADTHALIAEESFSGTSTATAGTLVGYNRFLTLATPVQLGPGSYVIAADGFQAGDGQGDDLNGAEGLAGFVPDTFNSGGGVISDVGPTLFADAYLGHGVYPYNVLTTDGLGYNVASFQFFVPEPGSVAMMFGLGGFCASLACRKSRRRYAKK